MTGALAERDQANAAPRRVPALAADQLKSLIERIERLEVEKAGIADDIKDIFAESKGNGYCPKTIRKILKLRMMDASERAEAEHLLSTYCVALGMQSEFSFDDQESRDKE